MFSSINPYIWGNGSHEDVNSAIVGFTLEDCKETADHRKRRSVTEENKGMCLVEEYCLFIDLDEDFS